MNKIVIRIVSLLSVLSVLIGIVTLAKLKYDKRELAKAMTELTGTIYYTDSKCRAVKYDISTGSKKTMAENSGGCSYITDCYYDKKNDDIIYWYTNYDDCTDYIMSGKGMTNINIDDLFSYIGATPFFVLQNGFAYGINAYDDYCELCRLNVSTQKSDIFKLSDSSQLYQTQSKRLYFTDSSETVFYLDENKIYECPKKITNIVAANDDCVVTYTEHDDFMGYLTVFDADTWEEKFSVRTNDEPYYQAILSPDSTKLLYCSPLFGADDHESIGCGKVIMLDLKSGTALKYNVVINSGIHIVRFVDWTE
ncbi:MAG: hypothetical protein NC110_00425 [Ruminococcus sp.]|nr:hypothetical protein [Ruminococcus sp.]